MALIFIHQLCQAIQTPLLFADKFRDLAGPRLSMSTIHHNKDQWYAGQSVETVVSTVWTLKCRDLSKDNMQADLYDHSRDYVNANL